nr:sulfatase-like hydrolase/transferase [Oscillospiraceae bacterium]
MGKKKRTNPKKRPPAPKAVFPWRKLLTGLLDASWYLLIPASFFLVEVFGWYFLYMEENQGPEAVQWPLHFGILWALLLGSLIRMVPRKAARIGYGVLYFGAAVYAGFQTGYYNLFSGMMWLSDFRYAAEGADYFTVLFSYPAAWWVGISVMIAVGVLLLWKFPRWRLGWVPGVLATAVLIWAAGEARALPEQVFVKDKQIQYAGSDYGRAKSAEAAYDNMFNPHRLYQVCGLYQTLAKDIYANSIYPMTPAYVQAQRAARSEIDAWFAQRPEPEDNAMTGLLEGRNVVLVLMESMDDWMFGEHTPTLNKLRQEGIDFANFYTPVYGGIRTFNTEFCINTGSFLSSAGGYAFDFVTNHYHQSLANRLREAGYSAKTFHYNDPSFYSRGEFSPAMGYEEYVYYKDYITETDEKKVKNLLYDDLLLFDNEGLNAEFFREGQPTLNFIITRSAHLSYKYNEVLSYWGLKKYPQYKGLTGNEETDCAYLKARLVDDLFARLLAELEEKGQLENTVIIGVTDHYTYGYKNEEALYALSGVSDAIALEKTPCFIWSADLEPMEVEKVLNTSDLLPTLLNLLGVDSPYPYVGYDAFNASYEGYVPFSDGSWIYGDIAYDAGIDKYISLSGRRQTVSGELQAQMAETVQEFIRINNLILETDYYRE